MAKIFPGDKLRNGSIAIAETGGYVLAICIPHSGTPYATWAVDARGTTFAGRYFATITQAVDDFNQRRVS